MTYEEFLVHFNFPVTPKEFSLVFSAINSCIVSLFRDVKLVDMPIVNLTDKICGKICFSQTKNNKSIHSLFLKEVATKPRSISYWSKFVRIPKWESVWLFPHKFFVTNKVKKFISKLFIYSILLKHFLSKFKKDIDVNCSFCSYTWKLYLTSSGTVALLKSYGMMSQYLSQKRYYLTLYCILKMSFLDILFKIM